MSLRRLLDVSFKLCGTKNALLFVFSDIFEKAVTASFATKLTSTNGTLFFAYHYGIVNFDSFTFWKARKLHRIVFAVRLSLLLCNLFVAREKRAQHKIMWQFGPSTAQSHHCHIRRSEKKFSPSVPYAVLCILDFRQYSATEGYSRLTKEQKFVSHRYRLYRKMVVSSPYSFWML